MMSLQTMKKTFLSEEESKRLGMLVLQEDPRGYDGIIRWYWPYMCEIAREIARKFHIHDISELESAGGEKLAKIAPKWDYRKAHFPAFAGIQIRRELTKHAFAMETIVRKISARGKYPDRPIPVLSLHEPVKSEKLDDERELLDALENHDAIWPDHCIEVIDDLQRAPDRIETMKQTVANMVCPHASIKKYNESFEKNKQLFMELYGLDTDRGAEGWGLRSTYRDLAGRCGKSNQRIRQIEDSIWEKLSSIMEYTKEKLFEDIETILTFKKLGIV